MAACKGSSDSDSKSSATPKTSSAKPVQSWGTTPESFDCDSVAPFDAIKKLLGEQVERTDSHFRPPAGVPRPCVYNRTIEQPDPGDAGTITMKQQLWSFDLDCRDTAHKTARDLMKQHAASAGDAGVEVVKIGKHGLDHHGVALIFIDDDTPCHVRVIGPDPELRKELGRLVAERLNPKTAPIRLNRANIRRATSKKKK